MAETHNRLTIYRVPAKASDQLKYFSADDGLSYNPTRLGEEIYSWSTTVSIWDGISDEVLRTKMRDWLRDFDGSGRDGRQGIEDLRPLLEELEVIVQADAWISATSLREFGGTQDFENELRIMPALTFAQHLRWIYESFGQTPDLIVVYR